MNDWLRNIFQGRPWWMSALLVFSGFMAFIYVPWDLFIKPVESDSEVWFGIVFTGWAAKVMAVPHWFVYGAAVYGLRAHACGSSSASVCISCQSWRACGSALCARAASTPA